MVVVRAVVGGGLVDRLVFCRFGRALIKRYDFAVLASLAINRLTSEARPATSEREFAGLRLTHLFARTIETARVNFGINKKAPFGAFYFLAGSQGLKLNPGIRKLFTYLRDNVDVGKR